MKKYITTLSLTLLSTLILTACVVPRPSETKKESQSRTSTSSKISSSSTKTETSSSSSSSTSPSSSTEVSSPTDEEKTAKNLPKNADEAPKDKIYATGDAKVYYHSYGEGQGFEAKAPDYLGYTKEKVVAILGQPQSETTDPNEISAKTADPELENIKAIFQAGKITEEQAKAFYLTSYDVSLASQMGSSYTLYSYYDGSVILIFDGDELYYMTPNTDYLHFE